MRDPSIALIVFQPQRQPQGEQVQLNEIWNGRKGSQDDAFVVEFVRVFRVFTSDTNDGPLVARTVQTQGFLSATNASRCSLGSRSRQPASTSGPRSLRRWRASLRRRRRFSSSHHQQPGIRLASDTSLALRGSGEGESNERLAGALYETSREEALRNPKSEILNPK